MDDVKGELLERYKVLPALSNRLSEVENQNDELREKNRQMEQKLGTVQVITGPTGESWLNLGSVSVYILTGSRPIQVSHHCCTLWPP